MDDFERYYTKALKFLSYRPRSEKEVRDNLKKIKSKLGDEEVLIKKVVDYLKQSHLLNDEYFATWWFDQRIRFRQKSLLVIKQELKQKGISVAIIDSLFSSFEKNMIDRNNLRKLIEKKLKTIQGLSKQEIHIKLLRFLSGKGFDYRLIKEAIDEYFKKRV